MELDLNTKKDLKELILLRMNEEIDEEYINLLTEIVNGSSVFNGKVVVRCTEKKIMVVNYVSREILYNIEKFKEAYQKNYLFHKKYLDGVELKQFYGYYFPFAFLHEVSHIYQMLCASDNISLYPDVNDLYDKIYGSLNNFRNIDVIVYNLFHDKYCFERQANITASNICLEIFEDTELDFYSSLCHINNLFANGYSMKKNKVISPVERTFKFLRIKDKAEEGDLPFKVAFEHGFKISDEDFHYVYDAILERKGSIEYEDVMARVKTLIKRDSN